MIIKIGNNNLYHDELNKIDKIIRNYYVYIIDVLKELLICSDISNVNIILGHNNFKFDNSNKTYNIFYNIEHTLIKQESPTGWACSGKIIYNDNKRYRVRLDKASCFNNKNIILDYSLPNIHNVQTSMIYKHLNKKFCYLAPCLINKFLVNDNKREICLLTTFMNTNIPRRIKLKNELAKNKLSYKNVNTVFTVENMIKLYNNTKILINIHQTDYHDTFEELRVLPALLCGTIVICENSPLNELIPYNNLLIWCSYDDMVNKVKDVCENYDVYYNKIFTSDNIKILNNLHTENINLLKRHI